MGTARTRDKGDLITLALDHGTPAETGLARARDRADAELYWIRRRLGDATRRGVRSGLDHFDGRSWTGLHRHALTALIAIAF